MRNFDNTIVTISPITLVNGSFQNWIGMQKSENKLPLPLFYLS